MNLLSDKLITLACKDHIEKFSNMYESINYDFVSTCSSTLILKSRFLLEFKLSDIPINIVIYLIGLLLIYFTVNKKKFFHLNTFIYSYHTLFCILFYIYILNNPSDSASNYILGHYGKNFLYEDYNFFKKNLILINNFLVKKFNFSFLSILFTCNICASFLLIIFSKILSIEKDTKYSFVYLLKIIIILMPSYHIWTNSLSKELFIFFSFILLIYSSENLKKNIIYFILALLIIYLIRSYLLVILLLSFLIYLFYLSKRSIKFIISLLVFSLFSLSFFYSEEFIKFLFNFFHLNQYMHNKGINNLNDLLIYFSYDFNKNVLINLLNIFIFNPSIYMFFPINFNSFQYAYISIENLISLIFIITYILLIFRFGIKINFILILFIILILSYSNANNGDINPATVLRQKSTILIFFYYLFFQSFTLENYNSFKKTFYNLKL